MEKKQPEVIDLRIILQTLWKKKKLFFIILPITFILSCAYIVCVPRYYISELKLAPEIDNSSATGAIGSFASSLGIELGNTETTDAISPMLYPDLMEDNGFVASLFNINVENVDGSIHTTYYNYLKKHQEFAWWTSYINSFKSLFKHESPITVKSKGSAFNPYMLNKGDHDIMEAIKSSISISFDKKDVIITISSQAQDPLICKTMADSVKTKLQEFITDYRTRKARIDVEYYQKLTNEAKREYETVREQYVHSADANTEVILESVRAKVEDLENDMQLKYNTYTALEAQLQSATAKVQARTPAFTMIKGAEVPLKPAGPKRMIFVAAMTFLVFILISLYAIKDFIFKE